MAYCENCGNKLSDTAKFCSSCGHKVTIFSKDHESLESGQVVSEIMNSDNNEQKNIPPNNLDDVTNDMSYKKDNDIQEPIGSITENESGKSSFDEKKTEIDNNEYIKYFGAISNNSKVFLGEGIPTNKLVDFIRNFDLRMIDQSNFEALVYYDDYRLFMMNWGYGYLIASENGRLFLLINHKDCPNSIFTFTTIEGFKEIKSMSMSSNNLIIKFYNPESNTINSVNVFTYKSEVLALYNFYKSNFDNRETIISEIPSEECVDPSPIKPKDGAGIR